MTISKSIIFDLDGTLIDSSPGILSSLAAAFAACGVRPNKQLEPSLVGPPLRETILGLASWLDQRQIDEVITCFKHHYDQDGHKQSQPYAGTYGMLTELLDQGISLHIATNKREKPTKLILAHLSWDNLFLSVFSPDSIDPPSANKANLLATLMQQMELTPSHCLYVGDRAEDWHSAKTNGIRFAWARWGYSGEPLHFDDDSFCLASPDPTIILDQL